MDESTPLLYARENGTSVDAPAAVAGTGLPKSVSLLLEDKKDHVIRLVEPGNDDEYSDSSTPNAQPLCRPAALHHRSRSESHGSVMEIIVDVKETIVDVLHEDLSTPIKPREEGEHDKKLSAAALAVMVSF